jgi:hypothetical protein
VCIPVHRLSHHDLEEGEDGTFRKAVDESGLGIGLRSGIQTIRGRDCAGQELHKRWDVEYFSSTDEIRVLADHLAIAVVIDEGPLVAIAIEVLSNGEEGIARLDRVNRGLSHVFLLFICS